MTLGRADHVQVRTLSPLSRVLGRTVLAASRGELRRPGRCAACGATALRRHKSAIRDALVDEWGLSDDERARFDRREGLACVRCLSSLRAQALAAAIVEWARTTHGVEAASLAGVVASPALHRLAVAEVNPCGALHPILLGLPGLAFSDYGDPVRSQDLQALTYADASFDLMVSSETLEHVPDIDAALGEIGRVLKPGGVHLFTVPVIWDRETRARSVVDGDGGRRPLLADSFHGRTPSPDRLVFREYGGDVLARLSTARLSCTLAPPASADELAVFAHRRTGDG